VLRGVRRIYQDVVKVYHYTDVKEVGENLVHEALEGRRCVTEAKWHDIEFEGPIPRSKRGLPLVSRCNTDEVVSISKIQLGESFGSA
jgi:hypothetical protein